MSEVSAERWRRYGHDRLYVKRDGEELGWRDLNTGEDNITDPDLSELYHQAVAEFLSVNPPVAVQAAVASHPTPKPAREVSQQPEERAEPLRNLAVLPEVDLATNRAGTSARGNAQASQSQAPVRSFLAKLANVHTEERAWRIGAEGEKLVAKQLEKLQRKFPGWQALHDIVIGARGANLDHVVIGPGGIFVINTKHHPEAKVVVYPGSVYVNGAKQPYQNAIRKEAQIASERLTAAIGTPVAVRGIVAIVRASSFDVKAAPSDVDVVPRRGLVNHLLRFPQTLTQEEISTVFTAMRKPSTWLVD